jgi:hypothetical protein
VVAFFIVRTYCSFAPLRFAISFNSAIPGAPAQSAPEEVYCKLSCVSLTANPAGVVGAAPNVGTACVPGWSAK